MFGFREIKMAVLRIWPGLQSEVRTHITGQVVSYNATTNTAEIQPVTNPMRFRDPDNMTTKQLPPLKDVPVKMAGSGKGFLTFTPAVGTYGTLHVSDREIETWLSKGGIVDSASPRMHSISDAVFEPSLLPLVDDGDNGLLAEAVEDDRISMRTRTNTTSVAVLYDETIEIKNEKCTVTVDVDGNVTIENDGDTTVTTGGNVTTDATETVLQTGADYAVQFTAMQTAFDALKSELNTLVTTFTAHVHPGVLAGAASTGPTPTPGIPPTASMAGAKVTDVRLP